MKFLMLNPPFLPKFSRFSRSPAVTKSGTIYYPIWHAYATGLLQKEGFAVKLIDAPAENFSEEDCYKIVKDFIPDVVVVYTSTPSIYNDIAIAGNIKDILKDIIQKGLIILTGPHVSALPEESLRINDRIDAIARHEYDVTLVEIAKKLARNESIENISGLTIRKGQEIISTPNREFINDLDSLPFVSSVYRKHLKIENYFYAHCRNPVVSIFSSRGCNAHCNYCLYPQQMFGRRQRQRSPENIVAEFLYIQKELPQVKEVLIDDDTFSFNQNHTIKFCELMISNKVKIPWTVECRANVKYETLKMMKAAGCRLIVAGFESFDKDILKNVKKGITIEQIKNFIADIKKAGIMLHACFMAGNQGETRATLINSLNFAKEINADTCQFFPLMVYPGTEAYEWAKSNGYLTSENYRDWLTQEGLHNCVVSTESLSANDLMKFCDYARKKYYLSPKYLSYKFLQMFRNPAELNKTLKAAKTFAKYLLK